MRRGPQARTDVENEKALADLATGRSTRRTTRRTAIVEPELDEFDYEAETPKRNSKPKSAPKSAASWGGRGRWKCCSCGTWTRDPAHRACLECRKLGD